MPMPAFALARIASSAGIARISSICRFTCRYIGVGQVDLVDDRDDREPLLDREMHIGDRLRLHALRRVHDHERAFARREAARNFIGEIHMARRIEQVQPICLPVFRLVVHRDTGCALIVMPRSRSRSIESSN